MSKIWGCHHTLSPESPPQGPHAFTLPAVSLAESSDDSYVSAGEEPLEAPVFEIPLQDAVVAPGADVLLKCIITANPPPQGELQSWGLAKVETGRGGGRGEIIHLPGAGLTPVCLSELSQNSLREGRAGLGSCGGGESSEFPRSGLGSVWGGGRFVPVALVGHGDTVTLLLSHSVLAEGWVRTAQPRPPSHPG